MYLIKRTTMDNCVFCKNEFSQYRVEQYSNWDVQVFRDDQYYIGRLAVVLKGRHIENMVNLTKEEREELFELVLPDINRGLNNLFSPDHYNYASLGNDCRHLHLHVIPRYKNPVTFDGTEFEDEYWNQTYKQDYERIELPIDKLNKLRSQIKESMY